MWHIEGRDAEGNIRDVKFTELNSASRPAIRARFHDIMGARTPEVFEWEMESPDPLPGIDGIEFWGARAAELLGPDRLAYRPIATTDKGHVVPGILFNHIRETTSIAFHAPEVLMADVSGIRELKISGHHTSALPSDFTSSGSVLESRIYSDGAVIEAEAESSAEMPSFRVTLPSNQGGWIARIANWIARPFKVHFDPFMHARLTHYEQRYPVIAKHYPDISLALSSSGLFRAIHKAPIGTAVIVFVHGTYSCAVPHLALLHPLKLPTYRFEHETFQPVTENKNSLVKAVREFIPKGARIHFVAHSRGGLVSRFAARELNVDYDVHVMTYGTPHRGTPLANAGERIYSALLAGGRAGLVAGGGAAARTVFSWDPPSLAGKLLLKGVLPSGFPPGLDAMRPDSDFIGALGSAKDDFLMSTWGGECDLDKLSSGAFAYGLREAITGAFGGVANDTVVGVDSALGAGTPQKVLASCTHFQYFSKPEVRDEIRSLA
jgi:hypothetical protein